MSPERRRFLQLAGLGTAGAVLSGCSPLYSRLAGGPRGLERWPAAVPAATFAGLNRLTYGPTPEERELVREIGLAGWIEEQLAAEQIDDWEAALRLRPHDLIEREADALVDWDEADVTGALQQATLLRRVYSRRQLYELMVEFWTDHFNIAIAKEDCWALKVVDDREVVRPHALGRFGDLLQASAHSPAMLIYLDNQVNVREWPNENYAREVMELHTLGVNGGYSQDDVMELARMLTGWTVKEHFSWGEFTFDPDIHDDGAKILLGRQFAPAGQGEGEAALAMLAAHPSTGEFISGKLVRRFISDRPERDAAELTMRAAEVFRTTQGDIRAVLRVILLDGLLQFGPHLPPKFKRPVEFVTSALRQLQVETDGRAVIIDELRLMGQAPYEWPTPDGPPDMAEAWLRNFMPRWRFALALARDELAGTTWRHGPAMLADAATPEGLVDRVAGLLLDRPLDSGDKNRLLRSLEPDIRSDLRQALPFVVAAILASPGFQWR